MANGISIPTPQVTTLGQAISGGSQEAQKLATVLQNLRTAQAREPLIKAQTTLAQAQATGIPAKSALNAATARKTLQDIDMVNKVGNAQTPPLMRAYNLFLFNKGKFGENDRRTIASKNTYDTMSGAITSGINYKNAIAAGLPLKYQPPDIREAGFRSALARGGVLPTPSGITLPGQQQQAPQQQVPQQQGQAADPFVAAQSTKYSPTVVRNAVLGTGDTPQHAPELAQPEDSTSDPSQPNRLVHPAPQSGDINAQQRAILGQFSPAGKAQQQQSGKDVQTYVTGLGDASEKANDTLSTLRQFDAAYKQIKGSNRGPVGGLIKLAGTPLNAQAQVALKNGNQVVLNNLGILKGTGSRISQKLIGIMEKGNPNVQLSPDAEKEIVEQLSAQFQGNIHKSRLANTILAGYPSLRNEPQLLQEIVTKAAHDASPVDEQGKIHPEMFDEWANYAHPQAIEAIRSGQDWLPEDVKDTGKTIRQFRDVATAKNIPILSLIKRFRGARQRQRAGGAK